MDLQINNQMTKLSCLLPEKYGFSSVQITDETLLSLKLHFCFYLFVEKYYQFLLYTQSLSK